MFSRHPRPNISKAFSPNLTHRRDTDTNHSGSFTYRIVVAKMAIILPTVRMIGFPGEKA